MSGAAARTGFLIKKRKEKSINIEDRGYKKKQREESWGGEHRNLQDMAEQIIKYIGQVGYIN